MGITVNGINSYLQARWIYSYSPPYTIDLLLNPLFIIGIVIFISGIAMNLHLDYNIRNLRQMGETRYKFPDGGMLR